MQSTLKTTQNNLLKIFFIFFIFSSNAHSSASVTAQIYDTTAPANGKYYLLVYSKKARKIWIQEKNKKTKLTLKSFTKNGNPELVGADKSIKFITKTPIQINKKTFLGLTVAERSMRGNGMGQCGAGAEEFFISLLIEKNSMAKVSEFKTSSCIEGIDLIEEQSIPSIEFNSESAEIFFHWLNYPEYEKPVTGKYRFFTNKLEIMEN